MIYFIYNELLLAFKQLWDHVENWMVYWIKCLARILIFVIRVGVNSKWFIYWDF